MDTKSNLAFYRNGQGSAEDVLMGSTMQAPPIAKELVSVMNKTTSDMVAMSEDSNQRTASTQQTKNSKSSSVKTYGINDGQPDAGVNY